MKEQFNECHSLTTSDAEAIRHLKEAIAGGKHWYVALLEAIGRWGSAAEDRNGRAYCYLIAGEAFDWLLLAERLCGEVNGLLPADERDTLLFHGRPPLDLSPDEVRGLIGTSKYRQYLNYFYGVTVEKALALTVEEEVEKERRASLLKREEDAGDEAFIRIYGTGRMELLKRFRSERGLPQRKSVSLTELKQFTYWLFKYRIDRYDKARVASDTRKGLERLRRQWADYGHFGVLATEETFAAPAAPPR
jgi:hypothetical protein